jgi:plasmid segregation protein ParM
MPNYLGVDIGYSNLKAAKTTAGDVASLKSFVRGDSDDAEAMEFSILCRPAGALEASKMPRSIFKKPDDDGIAVTVDGVEWRAGLDFSLNSDINRELSSRYIHTPEWTALLYAALAWAKWDSIDTLVLGLPCDEFYQNPAAVEHLKNFAKGTHQITAKKSVEVLNVIVAPQPIGSLMGYLLSDATPEEDKHLNGRVTTLILDPGYYSFDFVAVQNGGIVQDTASSSRYSVRDVCHEIENMLSAKFPDSNLPDGEIEHAIRSQENKVLIGGDDQDITDEINKAVKIVANRALSAVRSNLASNKVFPRIVLLTGGGANLFEDAVRGGITCDEFLMSDASVLMNSFGYLRIAIDKIDAFS